MVYKNPSKVIPISVDTLQQFRECFILARQELEGAGHEGWVCTTGVDAEIAAALSTIGSLLSLTTRLEATLERALEHAQQRA